LLELILAGNSHWDLMVSKKLARQTQSHMKNRSMKKSVIKTLKGL